MELSKIYNVLNKRRWPAALGIGFLAAAVMVSAPDDGGSFAGTKYGWDTLQEGGEFKHAVATARDLLIQSDASYATMIADSALSFIDEAKNGRTGAFILTKEGDRAIVIFKNENMYRTNYEFFKKVNEGKPDTPSYEDFKTMNVALTISNETAHYWQSKQNPDFIFKLLEEGVGCTDKLAIESSSDAFMVASAVKMHRHLTENGTPEALRQKNALDWAMMTNMFPGFAAYAENPHSAQAKETLRDYLDYRTKEYKKYNRCEKEPETQISAQAAKAIQGSARIL